MKITYWVLKKTYPEATNDASNGILGQRDAQSSSAARALNLEEGVTRPSSPGDVFPAERWPQVIVNFIARSWGARWG